MQIEKMKTAELEKEVIKAKGAKKDAIIKELNKRELDNEFGVPVRRTKVDASTKRNNPKALEAKVNAKKVTVDEVILPKKTAKKVNKVVNAKKTAKAVTRPNLIKLPGVKNRADIIGKKVQFTQYLTGKKIKGVVTRLFKSNRDRTFVGIKTDTPGKYICKKLSDVTFL